MKKRKNEIARKFAEELQLPETAVHNTFTIEFHGESRVIIEGCMGILDYSDEYIAVNLGSKTVRFKGANMQMDTFFESQAVIKGNVISMDFSG